MILEFVIEERNGVCTIRLARSCGAAHLVVTDRHWGEYHGGGIAQHIGTSPATDFCVGDQDLIHEVGQAFCCLFAFSRPGGKDALRLGLYSIRIQGAHGGHSLSSLCIVGGIECGLPQGCPGWSNQLKAGGIDIRNIILARWVHAEASKQRDVCEQDECQLQDGRRKGRSRHASMVEALCQRGRVAHQESQSRAAILVPGIDDGVKLIGCILDM